MRFRYIFLSITMMICLCVIHHGSYAKEVDMGVMTPQQEVDHYQAQGYMHIIENRLDRAAAAFGRAGAVAVEHIIWDGCIDAALGLIMITEYPKARALLKKSIPVIVDSGDLRANIAMAYAILALKPDDRRNLRADRYIEDAYALSRYSKNAYGLIETSKAFLENIDRGKSYALLFEAKMIAEKRRNAEVMELLAYQFLLHGNVDVSDKCRFMGDRYSEQPLPAENADTTTAQNIAELKELQQLDAEQRDWVNTFSYLYKLPVDLSLGYSPHARRVWCTNRLVFYTEINKRYRRER